MIKLKNLLKEQNYTTDPAAKGNEWMSLGTEYIFTYEDGAKYTKTQEEWLDIYSDIESTVKLRSDKTFSDAGIQQLIDFTKETETRPDQIIKSIVKIDREAEQALTLKEENAWKYYVDYGIDLEYLAKLNWTRQEAIDYQVKVWEPLLKLGDKIEKFWSSVTTKGSESYELFQPYNQFWDDKQYLARNEWWKQVGSKEYQTARRIQNEEVKIYGEKGKRNAYKFMYALFDDRDDSIYQEIAETINNEVVWSIKHPLTNETYEFRADPEFDDW